METNEGPRRGWKAVRILAILGSVVIALWLVGQVLEVVLILFAGLLCAAALTGASGWIADHTPLGRRVALAAICLTLVGMGVLVTALAAPSIGRQVDELSTALPRAVERLVADLERFGWGREIVQRGRDAIEGADERRALSQAGGLVSSTLGAVGSLFVILFVGLVVAIEPRLYHRGAMRLVPPAHRERAAAVLEEATSALRRWVLGRLLEMVLVGALTWLGLHLLGIPLSLTLALIAAVLTLIPNFGPVLSAVPAVLLGLLEGPAQAGYVIALYFGIQTLETYAVTPIVEKRTVSLPPALTMLAQVLMGTVAGAMGLFVATPLTAAGLVFVHRLYVDRLESGSPASPP